MRGVVQYEIGAWISATLLNVIEGPSNPNPVSWQLLWWSVGIELLILIPVFLSHPDTSFSFLVLGAVPALLITSVVLLVKLIRAAVRHGRPHALPVLVTLVAIWAVPILFQLHEREHPFELYEAGRWWTGGGRYKAEVLAQPSSDSGDLKYVVWDESGLLAGMTTWVYLVYDPSDHLSAATEKLPAGSVKGIPCKVYSVQRLERDWYSVVFYMNDFWGSCTSVD